MSKVLRIQEGGYKIIAKTGSEIKLDTGETGQVTIVGSLNVTGITNYINVTDMQVEDNIIELNKGDRGTNGISRTLNDGQAGLMIQRGTNPVKYAAQIFFDEEITHYNPARNARIDGSFVLKNSNNDLVGLQVNSISTGCSTGITPRRFSNLVFDLGDNGVLSVVIKDNSNPYEERIDQGNDIPNLAYIRRYVAAEAGNALIERMYRYKQIGGSFVKTNTGVQTYDTQAGDSKTEVQISVSDSATTNKKVKFVVDNDGVIIGNATVGVGTKIRIDGTTISSENSDSRNLKPFTLAPNDGIINFETKIAIKDIPANELNPIYIQNKTLIYTRQEQRTGGTGIYYTNQGSSGELISATKALVYGLIF
jgi:hypothetical protein